MVITIKYVILKSFRDTSGMRLPGELIELAPSRAVALRGCGLIGGEYVEPEKDDEQPDGERSSDERANDNSSTDEPEKDDEKTETKKSTESRKRVK